GKGAQRGGDGRACQELCEVVLEGVPKRACARTSKLARLAAISLPSAAAWLGGATASKSAFGGTNREVCAWSMAPGQPLPLASGFVELENLSRSTADCGHAEGRRWCIAADLCPHGGGRGFRQPINVSCSTVPKVRPTPGGHPRPPRLACTRRSPLRRTRGQRRCRSHSRCRLSLAPCRQRPPPPRASGALRRGG